MSEERSVTERVFSTTEQASALTLAALWSATHPEFFVETIVGDGEFVYLYYVDAEEFDKEAFGDASVEAPMYVEDVIKIPRYSLANPERTVA